MIASDFKNLLCWQKAILLCKKSYPIISRLPMEERFALCDQMRRSVVSIPSNIAEGHARYTNKEFIHFLSIARGSAAEFETQLLLCVELGYLIPDDIFDLVNLTRETSRISRGLMQKLIDEERKKEEEKTAKTGKT